jgi:cold shock CspA family protein/ribosome-associated translation inhibitor RaiA
MPLTQPLQISFRNMDASEAVEARIREEVAKLERFYDHIMGCRVIVEIPRKHLHQGKVYHIRIDLTVPGAELVINHEPTLHGASRQIELERTTKALEVEGAYKDIHVAIRDAFKAARRRVQDYARRRRRDVKAHAATPHARVTELFPEEGYGFLETPEGAEVYFHRNSVLGEAFDHLRIGTEVKFVEEEGEKGPQASTVRLARRHAR